MHNETKESQKAVASILSWWRATWNSIQSLRNETLLHTAITANILATARKHNDASNYLQQILMETTAEEQLLLDQFTQGIETDRDLNDSRVANWIAQAAINLILDSNTTADCKDGFWSLVSLCAAARNTFINMLRPKQFSCMEKQCLMELGIHCVKHLHRDGTRTDKELIENLTRDWTEGCDHTSALKKIQQWQLFYPRHLLWIQALLPNNLDLFYTIIEKIKSPAVIEKILLSIDFFDDTAMLIKATELALEADARQENKNYWQKNLLCISIMKGFYTKTTEIPRKYPTKPINQEEYDHVKITWKEIINTIFKERDNKFLLHAASLIIFYSTKNELPLLSFTAKISTSILNEIKNKVIHEPTCNMHDIATNATTIEICLWHFLCAKEQQLITPSMLQTFSYWLKNQHISSNQITISTLLAADYLLNTSDPIESWTVLWRMNQNQIEQDFWGCALPEHYSAYTCLWLGTLMLYVWLIDSCSIEQRSIFASRLTEFIISTYLEDVYFDRHNLLASHIKVLIYGNTNHGEFHVELLKCLKFVVADISFFERLEATTKSEILDVCGRFLESNHT